MCGIILSFNKEKFKSLVELNQYRGTHSWSFCVGDSVQKGFGPFPNEIVDAAPDGMMIGHVQAPTTEAKDMDSIHPAEVAGSRLWHNGIIKHAEVQRLKTITGLDSAWDTLQLLKYLLLSEAESLSEVDGSFACILKTLGDTYVFRNDISPLYTSEEEFGVNISSCKFEESTMLDSGRVFLLSDGRLQDTMDRFTTANHPFFFGEDE